ncbi:MAG: hypothetical protein K6B65_00700 [Bacilli bacterium]|nr:hypothetical protein [Bacilli bacterium]
MEEERETITNRKKALVLYSTNTGHIAFLKHKDEVDEALSPIFDLTYFETKSREEGETAARNSCGQYDALILYGGDGTLNNIINVLSRYDNAPVLAYLGGGTLNDGGKNFGVKNLRSGLKVIKEGHIGDFDVIRSGDSSFFYLGGFGAYMDVSYVAKRRMKKAFGRFVYYLLCIKEVFFIQRHKVKITNEDGVIYDGKVCSLSILNGKWLGGMKVNGKGKVDDGKAEILIVKPRLFNGFLRYIFHRGFVRLSGKNIKIEIPEDQDWCFDGEKGPKGNIEIEVVPHALKAYCSPEVLK